MQLKMAEWFVTAWYHCLSYTASIATAFLLFYSEASAAKKAGLQVVILKREGNAPLSEAAERQFVTIRDFSEFLTV